MFDLKTKILVVDDMLTMRKLVQKSCKELGFTDFTEAKDGREAWELIGSATPPFGLVLSDWNMPNTTGLDLLKRVRADSRFKALPFLLITAEAEKTQIVEAVKSGVTNYIIKPFNTETLKEKLEAAHKKVMGR
jgi:two-component system chemotaxis response regulator CheY